MPTWNEAINECSDLESFGQIFVDLVMEIRKRKKLELNIKLQKQKIKVRENKK